MDHSNQIGSASEFIRSKFFSSVNTSVAPNAIKFAFSSHLLAVIYHPSIPKYRPTVYGCVQKWIDSAEHKCNTLFFHRWWARVREFFQRFWPAQYLHAVSLLSKAESKIDSKSTFEKENCPLHNNWSAETIEFGIPYWSLFRKLISR